MSTLFLAIDIFWLIVFPGTQGALVIDDESNRDQFKATITRYLEHLPKQFQVRIRQHNRNQLVLSNGSVLYYLVAGTRKKGSFGHGKGLNFVHATELSRYGDKQAWSSFRSALAEPLSDAALPVRVHRARLQSVRGNLGGSQGRCRYRGPVPRLVDL